MSNVSPALERSLRTDPIDGATSSSPHSPHVRGRPDPIGGTTALGGESVPARGYLLDNARAETGERFVGLAVLFDGVTRGHFARLEVGVGSGCWEVGAGGRGIPEALAAAVRPTGHVLASDIDTSWLKADSYCRSRSAASRCAACSDRPAPRLPFAALSQTDCPRRPSPRAD